jgi:hypothetical protein
MALNARAPFGDGYVLIGKLLNPGIQMLTVFELFIQFNFFSLIS